MGNKRHIWLMAVMAGLLGTGCSTEQPAPAEPLQVDIAETFVHHSVLVIPADDALEYRGLDRLIAERNSRHGARRANGRHRARRRSRGR